MRVVKTHAAKASAEAKKILTRIQNKKRGPRMDMGPQLGLANSIYFTNPAMAGNTIFSEVKWGRMYGYLVEWGPSKKSWPIRAKYAKALRFTWPTAPMGGFTATQTGSKGGQKVMSLTENVFYFKAVKYKWDKSHLRPHVGPAMRKIEPGFIRDMLRIPREVLK